jgi:hypothetical protein
MYTGDCVVEKTNFIDIGAADSCGIEINGIGGAGCEEWFGSYHASDTRLGTDRTRQRHCRQYRYQHRRHDSVTQPAPVSKDFVHSQSSLVIQRLVLAAYPTFPTQPLSPMVCYIEPRGVATTAVYSDRPAKAAELSINRRYYNPSENSDS